jgi:hypothetical protein
MTIRARRFTSQVGAKLSAAIAESLQRVREEEGREALVRWLGPAGHASSQEREQVRAAWGAHLPARTSTAHGVDRAALRGQAE